VKALAVVVLLASAASAAPQGARTGTPYWFKTYSTAPYKEIWTGDLALKNFDNDVPKVVKAIEANGGKLIQPLANFVSNAKAQTQQIVFSLPRDNAKALLKSLRLLGDMKDPAVSQEGVPIPVDEVRAKVAVMMKEKADHAADLARVPAAAAAEEEILEHLLMVEELAARVVVEVRFNLSVRQK
jgi:hypothetical protein